MYDTFCELRDTYGRNRDDESSESTITGGLVAKFWAKVINKTTTTGYAGAERQAMTRLSRL